MAKKGLGKATQGAEICFLADKWGNHRFSAISYADGLLKVSVDSSPAASEIEMQKEVLFESINAKIGYKAVSAIKIVISRPSLREI